MAPEELDQQIEEKRSRLQGLVGKGSEVSSTLGINHLAVFALDLEATAEFYTDVLGMPVVSVASNRDEPGSTHMNVNIGEGVRISFFDFPHVERLQVPAPEGAGGMMHVAIPIPRTKYEEVEGRLTQRGIPFRCIEDSVYFKDPNGMNLELMLI